MESVSCICKIYIKRDYIMIAISINQIDKYFQWIKNTSFIKWESISIKEM